MISLTCLFASRLKDIFSVSAHFEMCCKPLSSWKEILGSCNIEKREYHLHHALTCDIRFSDRSFILTTENKGPKIKPCRKPALTDNQIVDCPFSIGLWSMSLRKLSVKFNAEPDIPMDLNSEGSQPCHTLPKVFDML